MSGRRVAVTGLGVVSAIGSDPATFWSSLAAGRSGIAPIERVSTEGLGYANAAEVKDFDPSEHFGRRHLPQLDRFSQFALVAARQAAAQAGLDPEARLGPGGAVILGSGIGGQVSNEESMYELLVNNARRIQPLTVARIMPNAAASQVAMAYGAQGPAFTVASACSSANHAIGLAFHYVRSGAADIAFAGGSEAPLARGCMMAWSSMRIVSPDTCRPFSLDRQGMILGEGGGVLVLESLDSAVARGAPVLAEIVGFGMSSDADHITRPSLEGPSAAMAAALSDGGLAPEQVGYINAHGTATPANDPTETRAIRQVFGSHADDLVVSSTKAMHGHALGAAGALEAIATVLAMHHGVIPPTVNYTEPDPECDLDVVPNEARTLEVEAAVSNSFAFGGLNAVLAFRQAEN